MLALTSWLFLPALFAAGIICVGLWRGRRPYWVLLPLAFVYLGAGRARFDVQKQQELAASVKAFSQSFLEARGEISALENREGVLKITLKNVSIQRLAHGEADGSRLCLPGLMAELESEEELEHELGLGQQVGIRGELVSFSQARNPGEFDAAAYYHAMGIEARLYGEELSFYDKRKAPLPEYLRKLREKGIKSFLCLAEPEDAGIFAAAVLGDKQGISKDIKALYQKNGIAHLLAISGLHMSFAGLLVYRLFRRAGLGLGGAGAAGAAMAFLYGMLTGGAPSVTRAALMLSVGFLAAYLGRTYDLLSAASLALIVLALRSPSLILQGGVQLSFGAVFAIGGLAPFLCDWAMGKERNCSCPSLLSTVCTAIAIQVVTLPMTVYHFYEYPLYGIVLNLLVIPFMGGVLCSGFGILLFGSLSPALGIWAAGSGHYILAFYEFLCRRISALPFCRLTLGQPQPLRLLAYGLAVGVVLGLFRFWIDAREKDQKRVWLRLFILAGLYGFCIALLFPGPVKGLKAVFLDVGQGDGALIRTGRTVILVDGGSSSHRSLGEYSLTPCLKSLGVSRIDYAFLSHGDQDHFSGLKYLLEAGEIPIGTLYLPYHGKEEKAIKELSGLASERGTRVEYLVAKAKIRAEGLLITCLSPGVEDMPEDSNEASTVLKMDYGACHMLFTGDMGENGERRLLERPEAKELSEINVLKTAHHGSKFSSGEDFLDRMKLGFAVISYGEGNSYGHPHEEVLERLRKRNAEILRTGERGAILMETDGVSVRFSGFVDGAGFDQYNRKQENREEE